jgi:CheY-like chemotaxis protein
VLLEVADNGRGMDADTQRYVFEPFFTTKTEGQGTGLGMAAVYGTVTQSDGHIDVSSAPGAGTTVSIRLPVVDGPADPGTEPERRVAVHRGRETVLLVEDERMVRDMVRDALSDWGYTVLAAHCPSEALRICAEHDGPIDLLITDVVMPEMDGKRLAERIVAERPATRLLYMSGYPSQFVGRHGVVGPGVTLLTKPISLEQLGHKVRELLDA